MKKIKLYRIIPLVFVLAALTGCKLLDEEVTDEDSSGNLANSPPSIWGTPKTSVLVQGQYAFAPDSSDADGDVLEYLIANKPAWAEFDSLSGALHGVPGEEDLGSYDSIIISVTDGNSVASLPSFTLTVRHATDEASDSDAGGSSAPSITGNPNKFAVAGSLYAFQPDASDPDGDTLSFSIVNRPSWATFDTTSGLLEGSPDAGDLGTTDPIEISVTDGANISALNEFTITVEASGSTSFSIAWSPPTQNVDGTPLTDLAGYRIYYGTASGKYSETVEVPAGVASYVIDNISPGTYYLVMTSFNSHQLESDTTAELNFEIGG